MKLLLTSAGMANQSIANALASLTGKIPKDTKIGFIPTAANAEEGNKDWMIEMLNTLQKFGFEWIDIVDISAAGIDWQERLSEVDAVFVSGGNTFHLLDQMRKVEFAGWFKAHSDRVVYVGVSAGSIVSGPSIGTAFIEPSDHNLIGMTDFTGLELVNFEVSPHYQDRTSDENNKKYRATVSNDVYGIDDQSAVKVNGELVEVISEGQWVRY